MHPPADDPGPVDWVREVRRHHEGTLLLAERATPVRFVIDGRSGSVVLPVERWMLDHPHPVLFLPEEREGALQLLLEFLPSPPSGEAQDRWSACHAEPRQRHWAAYRVTGARRDAEVCDAGDLGLVNQLHHDEPALLRLLNADRAALARLCRTLTRADVSDPCAVGVNPHGFDVRARFGIVRAEFPAPPASPRAAAELLRTLLAAAGGPDA